jgi:hypothetical protein
MTTTITRDSVAVRCKLTSMFKIDERTANFGVYDTRGRETGYRCIIYGIVYQPADESDVMSDYLEVPGTKIFVSRCQLRGGNAYRRRPSDMVFKTKEEALGFVKKTISEQKKKLQKA